MSKTQEALKLARTALQEVNYDQAYAAEISAIDDALAEQPAQEQEQPMTLKATGEKT